MADPRLAEHKGAGEKNDEKRANKAGSADKAGGAAEKPAARHGHVLPTPAWVAVCVAVLVIGVLAGHFLLGGPGGVSLAGRTTLSAAELDSTVATYTYEGRTNNITAREVLEEANGSALGANDDGTYNVPAASDVVAYAQNQILLAQAEDQGITVSDDELSDFASSNFGTDDFDTIAASYGVDADTVRSMLRETLTVRKLQDSVVTTELPEQPTQPAEPAEGQEDTPTADYASYVIALLGDEWDADANDWARTDGDYYATLSSYEITNDAATYAAASAAYSVASSLYQNAYAQRSTEWNSYTDALLSQATIQLGSLAE
ncbi:hypothetical protein [Olsenella profusa]|uniref:SurA N-terminal domain-containing protein n=1 Tax=Olsenella profusa TaxID=138595 RepID=A0ABS2F1Y2_9ACTN|nr:hypothetical protein [Olsenella profusa]MBM6774986.1 hypothetical protein [Olsenella profusa]